MGRFGGLGRVDVRELAQIPDVGLSEGAPGFVVPLDGVGELFVWLVV